jgi:3-hydroxymyristoyl/3-hydroxydecanoyl-(acyl carrier protein) dehydratase
MTTSGAPTEPEIRAVRETSDGVELDFTIPATLLYLQGHFPGFPVLPGVAQIDWAARLADRHLETGIGAARKFRVKFSAVIPPGTDLTLALRRSKDGRRLTFEYRAGERVMSSGSFELDDSP